MVGFRGLMDVRGWFDLALGYGFRLRKISVCSSSFLLFSNEITTLEANVGRTSLVSTIC
jgi:hypothetical protein